MPVLVLAAHSANVGVLVVVLAVGLVIGVFGHLIRSRTLILTGIVVIGGISAYVAFVLQPSSG